MIELKKRSPVESATVFVIVLLLYGFALWLLAFLMSLQKDHPNIQEPVQVQVVDVASAASAAAAQAVQPPAPEMIVPPPPEIEPPPINTEAPVQPEPPKVVKKKAPKKQEAAKPVKAAAAKDKNDTPSNYAGTEGQGMSSTPGQGQPDRTAGSRPLNGVKMIYPPVMQEAQKEGRVIVDCDIESSGYTSNCHVVRSNASAFSEEALRYVGSARYRPASKNGMPVKELGHRLTIDFKLGDD